MKHSAGLLMYAQDNRGLKIFLIHPGGPYWKKKDEHVWAFPKGQVEENEDIFEAAKREFEEETGIKILEKTDFLELGLIKLKSGKKIFAWAFSGTGQEKFIKSIETELEWPPKSGRKISVPENDKGRYFYLDEIQDKLHPAYWEFVEKLKEKLTN